MNITGTPGVSSASACPHTLCADPALIANDRTEFAVPSIAGLPLSGIHSLPVVPFKGLSGSKPPPLRTASLQTTLRI